MFTTILYVSLCFSSNDCVAYEPAVYTANTAQEVEKDLNLCAIEERKYMTNVIGTYLESDCYVVEGK